MLIVEQSCYYFSLMMAKKINVWCGKDDEDMGVIEMWKSNWFRIKKEETLIGSCWFACTFYLYLYAHRCCCHIIIIITIAKGQLDFVSYSRYTGIIIQESPRTYYIYYFDHQAIHIVKWIKDVCWINNRICLYYVYNTPKKKKNRSRYINKGIKASFSVPVFMF